MKQCKCNTGIKSLINWKIFIETGTLSKSTRLLVRYTPKNWHSMDFHIKKTGQAENLLVLFRDRYDTIFEPFIIRFKTACKAICLTYKANFKL